MKTVNLRTDKNGVFDITEQLHEAVAENQSKKALPSSRCRIQPPELQ